MNISEETVILNIPNNYGFKATTVLSQQFEKMNYKEISNYIGQVTILALKGNEPAVKILFSKKLEDHCNAATAEYLRDSKEVYKWTIKGEKSKIHWR